MNTGPAVVVSSRGKYRVVMGKYGYIATCPTRGEAEDMAVSINLSFSAALSRDYVSKATARKAMEALEYYLDSEHATHEGEAFWDGGRAQEACEALRAELGDK